MDFAGGGFVPSLMGGFYLDFGLSAVFVGMVFYGVVLGWTYQNMVRKKNLFWILIYANILVYGLNSIRGMFMQDLFFVWMLMVLTGIHLVSRKKDVGGRRGSAKAGPGGSFCDIVPMAGG
jgi:oligosaccharide repeat unit polymerase